VFLNGVSDEVGADWRRSGGSTEMEDARDGRAEKDWREGCAADE